MERLVCRALQKGARVTIPHSAVDDAAPVVGAATDRTALPVCDPPPQDFDDLPGGVISPRPFRAPV